MKLVTLALIAAFTAGASAQSNQQNEHIPGLLTLPPGPIVNLDEMNLQIGCPVAFTNVSLSNPGHFMHVKQSSDPSGSLAFQYKNQSGRMIQSIEIRVELTVKKSIYDLDAATVTRDMTLTGEAADTLPLNVLAYGIGRVTLEQVNYVDGKAWTPKAKNNCTYRGESAAERIAR